ncbi:unnamed protein product [Nippostrongylus brasiliensis]|uniref:CCHC-type domain-containing protein n=1 Tax=Nippostrongylus brasiliensis TaxID=27835 RepID=A0A0N4Y7B8_NIPBR|nr:unnamed protein product [Nippostrongylus brasiliensis]
MSCQNSRHDDIDYQQEDLLDMDISSAEAAMAELQRSAPKKVRISKKQRQKRGADTTESDATAKPPAKRPSTTMPVPKMVLRPLMVSQEEKADMSPKDIRDIFYAIMDGIQDIKRKQDRTEDRLRSIDSRLRALEVWAKEHDEKKKKRFIEMQPGCPAVPNSRYCEVCFVAGHQAADCRSKTRMDPDHVELIYKNKNICKKCHCIHP